MARDEHEDEPPDENDLLLRALAIAESPRWLPKLEAIVEEYKKTDIWRDIMLPPGHPRHGEIGPRDTAFRQAALGTCARDFCISLFCVMQREDSDAGEDPLTIQNMRDELARFRKNITMFALDDGSDPFEKSVEFFRAQINAILGTPEQVVVLTDLGDDLRRATPPKIRN